MKDSQDWLELTIDETLRNRVKFIGNNEWSMIGYPDEVIQELKSAIRKHILQEALEMINSTPKLILKGKFEDDMGLFGDYVEVVELRNKFNDKYKED